MSLSETAQIYELLMKIDEILSGITVKSADFERNAPITQKNLATFKQLERLALRWLALGKKFGLPVDISNAVDKLSELIVTVRMAQISINMMMATNPITALIGVAGIIGTAASMGSMLEGY